MEKEITTENLLSKLKELTDATPDSIQGKELCIVVHKEQIKQYLEICFTNPSCKAGKDFLEFTKTYKNNDGALQFLGIELINVSDIIDDEIMIEGFKNKMLLCEKSTMETTKEHWPFVKAIQK